MIKKFNFQTEEELIKSRDEKVTFDEKSHIYYYNNKKLISVTQFIKLYTPHFDSIYASNSKSKKNREKNLENKDNKKEITNPIELRKFWRLLAERSTNLGTAAHIFSQLYVMDRTVKPKSKYDEAVLKAINDLEKYWDIILQEDIVYNVEYMLAGSIDLILKHKKTGEYWIADWKTTEDMNKGYGKLLKPFNSLINNALSKYSVQLDLYSFMCNYYIPEPNKLIIQLKSDGSFQYYSRNNKDENFNIPYTYDKTKEALEDYKNKNLTDYAE